MTVQAEGLATWENVTALMDIKDLIVQLVCVPYYVHLTDTTVVVYVTAKRDGKVQNVIYQWLNANYRAVLIMDVVLKAIVTVNGVGKDYTASNRTVSIHRVLAMVHVYQASVTVRLVGKETTAV